MDNCEVLLGCESFPENDVVDGYEYDDDGVVNIFLYIDEQIVLDYNSLI